MCGTIWGRRKKCSNFKFMVRFGDGEKIAPIHKRKINAEQTLDGGKNG